MGLFRRKPRNGVRGTAQVVASTAYAGRAVYQRCRLHLVVQVEGMEPYSVEHGQLCPAKKWPHPGSIVPVVVDRNDPSTLRIDFDAMPDSSDLARQAAERQAAMLRATPSATAAHIPPAAGDRLTQLERLARLRASGALTDQEFDAEKRRLLSS